MNERDYIAITQIAYTDFPDIKGLPNAKDGGNDDIFAQMMRKSGGPVKVSTLINGGKTGYDPTDVMSKEMLDWNIVGVYDTNNDRNGLGAEGVVAYIMDDGKGNAVIAFRGTDQDYEWAHDTELVNAVSTKHQESIKKFLVSYQDVLKGYNSISITGHSLGGNDSIYTALELARMGMGDKIDSVYSMDGPGVSQEFLNEYEEEIAQIGSKLHHRIWSWVGSLLNPIPGADNVYVATATHNPYDDDRANLLTKHDTKYVMFDENGNMVPGVPDLLMRAIGSMSKKLDAESTGLGNGVRIALSGIIVSVFKLRDLMFDDDGITLPGVAIIGGLVLPAIALVIAFPLLVPLMFTAIAAILAFVYYEFILETLGKVVQALWQACVAAAQQLASWVSAIVEWLKGLVSAIGDFFKGFADWFVGKAKDCLDAIGGFVSNSIDWVNEKVKNAYRATVGIANGTVEAVKGISVKLRDALTSIALQSWLWTTSTVSGIVEAARRHVDLLMPMLTGGFVSLPQGALGVSQAFSGGALRQRDFSLARKQELINISQHFSRSEFWQAPERFWLRAERLAREAYPPAGDFFVAKSYAHTVARANQHGVQRIESVFREAYAADSEYAARIHAEAQGIGQVLQALRDTASGVGTVDAFSDRAVLA
jgi:hypothetical protein